MRGVTHNKDGSFTVEPGNTIHEFIREIVVNSLIGPTTRSFNDIIAMQDWNHRINAAPTALGLREIRRGSNISEFVIQRYRENPRTGGPVSSRFDQTFDIGERPDLLWLAKALMKRVAGFNTESCVYRGMFDA